MEKSQLAGQRMDGRQQVFIGLMMGSFAIMLALNFLTPLSHDDFEYLYVVGEGERVRNLGDIWISQYHHYLQVNGRSVVHTLAQLFLLIGKPIFNIVNSAAYVFMTVLIYRFSSTGKKFNIPLYILIHLMMWFFIPAFGDTVLWMTGASNYLWGGILCLLFVLPYKLYEEGRIQHVSRWFIPLMFGAGIIGGWCNENTSGACLFAIILFLCLNKANGLKIQVWQISGLIGGVMGFVMMIFAPGNSVRMSIADTSNARTTYKLAIRFINAMEMLKSNFILLILLFAVLFSIAVIQNKGFTKKIWMSLGFFVVGVACNFAMVLAPNYPNRAAFGVSVFFIIACMQSIGSFRLRQRNNAWAVCVGIATIGFLFTFPVAVLDIYFCNSLNTTRIADIEEQKQQGNYQIETYSIQGITKYSAKYSWDGDLGFASENDWRNHVFMRYYGLEDIKAVAIMKLE